MLEFDFISDIKSTIYKIFEHGLNSFSKPVHFLYELEEFEIRKNLIQITFL